VRPSYLSFNLIHELFYTVRIVPSQTTQPHVPMQHRMAKLLLSRLHNTTNGQPLWRITNHVEYLNFWLPVQRRVDYKLACFVFSSLSGYAPPYFADSIHTFGLRKSSTAATLCHRQIVCCSTHTQHIRRQELRCHRATCLEQSSGPLAHLRDEDITCIGLQQFQA